MTDILDRPAGGRTVAPEAQAYDNTRMSTRAKLVLGLKGRVRKG